MKWNIIIITLIAGLAFQSALIERSVAAENEKKDDKSEKPKFIGWLDEDKNGINDKFHDANGDGINDVTKEKYEHHFKFVDKKNDKINDAFIDKDGDGVNDLSVKFVDADKDGINDNVLDYNKDGINDITGLEYKKKELMGYRYGIVEEEENITHKKFIDKNGDGMHDPIARRYRFIAENADGINDRFVDKDGDGICDGRRFGRRQQNRGKGGMHGGGRGHGMKR